MSKLKYLVPAVVLLGGTVISSLPTYGKAEYMKATKKSCGYCHVNKAPKTKDDAAALTDAGKYYQKNKSLDGFTGK
jgi:hypothetical protein